MAKNFSQFREKINPDSDDYVVGYDESENDEIRIPKNSLVSGGGTGDMTKAVYDPNIVEGDAFDMDNMQDGAAKVALNKSAQNIYGLKTFFNNPKLQSYSAPTDDREFAPKKYVDDNAGGKEVLSIDSGSTFTINNATQLWLMNSKAHYYNGKTYLVYVDFNDDSRKIVVYDHTSNTWSSPETISSTGMAGNNATDENKVHAAPTIALDSSGYIHITYSDYANDNLYYIRSTNTENITTWNTEQTIATGEVSASYPTLIRFSDSNFTLFYRGSSSGNTAIKKIITTDGGDNWGSPETILTTGTASERIYYLVEKSTNDDVHLTWHFYDGTDNKDLHYLKSSNANTSSSSWTKADGTSVTTSVDADNTTTKIFDSSSWDTCYLVSMAYDGNDNPMIVVGLTDATNTNRIEFFRHNGTSWNNNTVISDNGVITTFTNQDVCDGTILWDSVNEEVRVAFVIEVSSQWEIQEYYSSDFSTWSKKRDITSGSTEPNVTPLYPQNTQAIDEVSLIWFSDGTADYGNGKDISYIGSDTSWSDTKIEGSGGDVANYDPVVIVASSEPSTMPDGSTIPENSILILTS